jgi:hypothetical protein
MCLDLPVFQLIRAIGHSGDEIVWPGMPDPQCRRGFHIQECIDISLTRNVYPIHIEAVPTSAPFGLDKSKIEKNMQYSLPIDHSQRIKNYLSTNMAVIIGPRHAVAWDTEMIYDPKGLIYEITALDFPITDIYLMVSLI